MTIRINNDLFDGNSGHGTEKIIGALTRCIVAVSRSDYSQNYRYAIPEAKALAYARDILLSINRTRSGGDSYFCINTLSSNPDLVVLVPSSRPSEPLSITVEFDESDCFFADCSANDKSGWIRTRNRIQKSWRKRFFVLSEGTLSFYRYDSPIPHGFRKQDVISDATISVDVAKDHPGYYVISIGPKNDAIQERYLYFNCMNKLISWTHALECMAKSPSNGLGRRKGTTSCTEIRQKIEQAMRTHLTTLGFNSTDIEQRLARLSAKSFSRVRISAHASQEYNICTKDPDGVDDDTWATTTATFCQSFRITSGRIVCGEEIVQIDVSGIGAAPDDVATTDKKNGVEDDVNDDENNKNNNNHGNQSNNDGPFSPTRRMLTLPRRKRSSFTDNTGKWWIEYSWWHIVSDIIVHLLEGSEYGKGSKEGKVRELPYCTDTGSRKGRCTCRYRLQSVTAIISPSLVGREYGWRWEWPKERKCKWFALRLVYAVKSSTDVNCRGNTSGCNYRKGSDERFHDVFAWNLGKKLNLLHLRIAFIHFGQYSVLYYFTALLAS